MKQLIKTSLSFLLLFLFLSNVTAQTKERTEIPEKYKWDLSVLYESVEAWQQAKNQLSEKVEMLDDNKGKLGESAETLYATIDLYFDALKDFYKLIVYANRLYDEDLRKSENQELTQQISNLGTTFSETTSYLNPEILQIEPETIEKFYNDFPALKDYALFIDDILRLRDHTLSPDQEQILASAGQVTGNPTSVYNIFDNAEKPLPKVELSTGEEVELSASMFVKYRTAPNREDRAKVFKAVFENYGKFENTIGANLAGKVKGDVFYSKNRKYNSALEMSLAGPNVPVSVYTTLIDQINKNLPTMHRFLELKKRMLGVDELHYYDLYTSIVKEVDMQFSVDEAQRNAA
ncbi:MAG: M3 family metallopeptidase [Melioribacteraceae bacterium]|nr:M3 family metallopeptidase [Melioribacteraceae bacterium]